LGLVAVASVVMLVILGLTKSLVKTLQLAEVNETLFSHIVAQHHSSWDLLQITVHSFSSSEKTELLFLLHCLLFGVGHHAKEQYDKLAVSELFKINGIILMGNNSNLFLYHYRNSGFMLYQPSNCFN
jgi:hypothetical protein